MRRALGLGLLSAALVAPLVALPSPAGADTAAPPAGAVQPDVGRNETNQDSCRLYGSSNGFGMVCNTGTGGGLTIRELLNGKPFPDCWHELLPESFTPPYEAPEGQVWLQRTCLRGVDRETYRRTGPITLEFRFVLVPVGGGDFLDEDETRAVQRFIGRGQIPFPIVTNTPTPSPRVSEPTSVSLLRQRTPDLVVNGVTMYAVAIRLTVDPADGGPVVDCDGGGARLTAEQIDRLPQGSDEACLLTYDRSSAFEASGQRKDRYPARVTALWEIHYYGADGVDKVLGRYEKSAINLLRVTEVQTLVTS